MKLTELKDKYKQHFIFKNDKMDLAEAKELVSLLKSEPISLDNDEMMWKLKSFISRREYYNSIKEEDENAVKQASKDIDYYSLKLRELGVVVVQPGEEYNDQIDYLNVTYHLNGKVIFKWYGGGVKVVELAPQIKEAYEVLINENCSNM